MSEMVERVAKAIEDAYECRTCGAMTAPINRCSCSYENWDKASPKIAAIAAIEAMLEPTLEMTFCGVASLYKTDDPEEDFDNAWKGAITAALQK